MLSQTQLMYFLSGSLGVLLDIFVVKIPKLQADSKNANHPFTFSEYLKNDWYAIVGSFVSVIIAVICLDELLKVKPELVNYVKWFFVFVGFTGSSLVQSVLSATSKKIQAIIDIKSNIADNVQPPINASNIVGAKEIVKDEEKINSATN